MHAARRSMRACRSCMAAWCSAACAVQSFQSSSKGLQSDGIGGQSACRCARVCCNYGDAQSACIHCVNHSRYSSAPAFKSLTLV